MYGETTRFMKQKKKKIKKKKERKPTENIHRIDFTLVSCLTFFVRFSGWNGGGNKNVYEH